MSIPTQKEKMLSGERYTCLDPGLERIRRRAKELMRRYNLSADGPERGELLQQLLGHFGEGSLIEPPFYCAYGENIHIGDYTYLNFQCTILDCAPVRIGAHVMLGPLVQLYTAAHDLQAEARIQGWEVAKPITLEDNVWIGGGAIILPGVRVGRNAVVGAGAVVTRDVPANTVVVGNPAKVIKNL